MSAFLVRPIKILESPHHVVFYRHSKAYVVSVESLSVRSQDSQLTGVVGL